ncbi:MAG TPA: SET domain-containing protein-lysine N-methyltransferase [Thermoguttaceae bacterium]|nr:SET domain-containing protein-lysine N-methyltransferase [Thermoguttaceae bacterium]
MDYREEAVRDEPEDGIRVEQTEVGLGVFAAREFFANEAIGHVLGTVVDDPRHGSDYCMELDEERGLEPAAPFRFVNHSCEPNSQLIHIESTREDGTPATTEIWVEAIRGIEPGEQVTIDYGWPADAAIPCRCRSANCRGWIVDEDELQYLHAEPEVALRQQSHAVVPVGPIVQES